MTPITLVCEASAGELLGDCMADARELADSLGCDVAFTWLGKILVVRPQVEACEGFVSTNNSTPWHD